MKHQSVDRERKIGIVLISFGVLLPLILLPFVSGYEKEKGFVQNLFNVGIVVKDKKQIDAGDTFLSILTRIVPGRLPYRFVLAFSVFLIFAGIVKIDISGKREGGKTH